MAKQYYIKKGPSASGAERGSPVDHHPGGRAAENS